MSTPAHLIDRRRWVAKRRGFRQAQPVRRRGARGPRPLEDDAGPEQVYVIPKTWRPMPRTESDDPVRARWVSLLISDPAAARRELLEAKRSYWQARLEALETRFRVARQAVIDALKSTEGADDRPLPPAPAAVIHELRIRRTAAWADLQAAKARLAEIERALADA